MQRAAILLLTLAVVAVWVPARAEEKSADELVRQADGYYDRKTFKKAIQIYERLLAEFPRYEKAHHARMRIVRSLLGLNQRWQALEKAKAFLPLTKEKTLERAEAAHLFGGIRARYWGGDKGTEARLDEAYAIYADRKMKAEQIAVLFDLATALSHSWSYSISYDEWEKVYYRPDPEKIQISWDEYQRREMKKSDERRYARVVDAYEEIVQLAGDGPEAPRALFRLGSFYVNVLARAFRVNAGYYGDERDGEMTKKMEELLARYRAEIEKGIAAFTRILENHRTSRYADDARFFIARTYHQRLNDFSTALTEYRSLLSAFPATEWRTSTLAAIQEITKEEIRLFVEKAHLPGKRPEIGLAARNVEKIAFTAYRLDMPALTRSTYRFHELDAISVTSLTPYAEWKVETGIGNDLKGVQKAVPLPFDQPGAFLVVAEGEKSYCRALVVISGMAMVVKTSPETALIFATDAVSGEPRPGVNIVLRANWRAGPLWLRRVFEAKTDGSGLAEIDLSGLPSRSANVEVVGSLKDHVALSRTYRSSPRTSLPYKVYTMTDRPVYRPRQTVHLKCILRRKTKGGYEVPAGKDVLVEIQNPRGEKVYSKTLVTNRHGSVSADLSLGEEPPLGQWTIRTFVDGKQYYCHPWTGAIFRVEEYKKPEFEVTVDAGAARVEPGKEVRAKVTATYYFGTPVAHGKIAWKVYRQPYRHWMPVPRRYSWYYGDLYPEPQHWWGRELVSQGEGLLDEKGEFDLTFLAQKYEDENDSRFFVEARVTDLSRREIQGSATIFATERPFFVRTEARRSLFKPGDSVEIGIRAEDANRRPVKSEGKLVLAKRVDREEEKEGKRVTVTDWVEIGSQAAATGEDGAGTARMVVDEEGQFRLSYVVVPENGPEIRHDTFVWAVTKDFRGSQYRFSNVEVLTDRDTYAVGDTIEVLVNSHVEDACILLTVEAGAKVLEKKVVKVAGKSHIEKIRVGESFLPNVYIKALTVRDEAVFLDRRQIIVPPVAKFLDVRISPEKEGTYLPGEAGKFTVTAVDATGEPVETELSLAFIDKSILYIQPDLTPDLRQFFYGEKRGDHVRLGSSFDFSFRGSEKAKPGFGLRKYRRLGQPRFMNPWYYTVRGLSGEIARKWAKEQPRRARGRSAPGYGDTDAGAEGGFLGGKRGAPPATGAPAKAEKLARDDRSPEPEEALDEEQAGAPEAEPKVRKFFPDTAYWNASVTTGRDGKATVEVTFPDSLTTWQATARAASAATAVGTARREFVTTKNLIIRLQAPRFFRERDELVVSGIVHNFFDEDVDVRAVIRTEGGCLDLLTDRGELSRPELSFRVPAKKEQRIDWWFRVTRPGRAKIHVEARSARESDAMVLPFEVYEHGVEKYLALSGSMTGEGGRPAGDGAAEMVFVVPEDRHEEATNLTVTVNPSLASTLLETLPYLADYPYGCVEQTMSRFLPSVVVRKTLLDLGVTLKDLGVDPEREVPEGYWGRKAVKKLKVLREKDLSKAVAAGVKRLRDFQNADGSWGWFRGSAADIQMTAYVVRGLALAGASGAEIDKRMIQSGATFLYRQLKGIDPGEREEKGMGMSPDLLVAALSAIAAVVKPGDEVLAKLTDWTYGHREELGAVSRARLAILLTRAGREREARIVCENLLDQALIDGENGTCRFGRNAGYYHWYDDAVEATAEALRAYLVVEPASELIPKMVKWLVGNRRGAHWKSTKDTAYATLALCDYLRATRELSPALTVTVSVDGRVSRTMEITKANFFTFDNAITLAGADLPAGRHVVRITKKGTGNLYYAGALTVFTREEDVKGAGNEIAIERKFFRVHPRTREVTKKDWVKDHYVERTVTETYEEMEPLAGGAVVEVGDEIEVQLVLTAKNDYRYLVFEDMKAAGLEAVELRSGHAYSGVLTYRELRDERAVFFCSSLRQGRHLLTYRLRAEIPGEYHALPAQGFAMYLPDVRAISGEFRLSVTEKRVR